MLPMVGAAAAAGAGAVGGTGPSAGPNSASSYLVGGGKVGLQWTNGDPTASTRIYYKSQASGCPVVFPDDLTFKGQVAPGVTSWESKVDTNFCNWFLVHYKDGLYSPWVQVNGGESSSCPLCPL